MVSPHASRECWSIVGIAALLAVALGFVELWWLLPLPLIVAAGGVAFFRDPPRPVPTDRNAVVAPADGRVSSVHRVDELPAFGGEALCVRIFISIFDVHVNRSPCHGRVAALEHRPGKRLSTLRGRAMDENESVAITLVHPQREIPLVVVRQIAGLLARTIVCHVAEDRILQRGERFGLIKLGSSVELYLPAALEPELRVRQGQRVRAGSTIIAMLQKKPSEAALEPMPAPSADEPGEAEPATAPDAAEHPEPGETDEPEAEAPASAEHDDDATGADADGSPQADSSSEQQTLWDAAEPEPRRD